MPVVALFGPDGSGKSTLARALLGVLRGRGCRARLSWMRGTHTLASILARLLSRFGVFRGSDNPYYGVRVPPRLRGLWQFLEVMSAVPVILLRFSLPSAFGWWVVADRYAPDLLVWVVMTTRDPGFVSSLPSRFLLSLTLKTYARFHITANIGVLASRREGEEVLPLREQDTLYRAVGEAVGAHVIDTTGKPVGESLREILTYLGDESC